MRKSILLFFTVIAGLFLLVSCGNHSDTVKSFCSNGNLHSQITNKNGKKVVCYFDCNDGKIQRKDVYYGTNSGKKKVVIYSKTGQIKRIEEYLHGKTIQLCKFRNNRLLYSKRGKGNKIREVLYYPDGHVKSVISKRSSGAINASIEYDVEGHVVRESSFYVETRYDSKKEQVYLKFFGQPQYDSVLVKVQEGPFRENQFLFSDLLMDKENHRADRNHWMKLPIRFNSDKEFFHVVLFSYSLVNGMYYCRENWFQLKRSEPYPKDNTLLIE